MTFSKRVTIVAALALATAPGSCSDPAEVVNDAGPADLGAEASADAATSDSGSGDVGTDKSTPSAGWALSAGGPQGDNGRRVAIDSKGNIYVVGSFGGSATFGATTLSAGNASSAGFVFKLDKHGMPQWAKAFGKHCYGLAIDKSDAIYITGGFYGTAGFGSTTLTSAGIKDAFVAKLDGTGTVLWATRAGGAAADEGIDVAVDKAGTTYVMGTFTTAATFGSTTLTAAVPPPAPDGGGPISPDMGGPPPPPPPPPSDGGAGPPTPTVNTFIAKLDSTGAFAWAQQSSVNWPAGIAVDDTGNSYFTGQFQGAASFGNITRPALGSMVMFVAKLDTAGQYVWVTVPGKSTDGSKGYDVATDSAGNVYVTGSCGGTSPFGSYTCKGGTGFGGSMYVARVDPKDGSFLWVRHDGGTASTSARGLSVDSAGNLFVAGYHLGTQTAPATLGGAKLVSSGGRDAYVTMLDAKGTFIWAVAGGSKENDMGYSVAADDAGGAVATGYFANQTSGTTATFGATKLGSQGLADVFVWKVE